jgi:hypothetical protein
MKNYPFICKTCKKEGTFSVANNVFVERKGNIFIEFSVEGEVKVSRKLIFKDNILVSEDCWQCYGAKK